VLLDIEKVETENGEMVVDIRHICTRFLSDEVDCMANYCIYFLSSTDTYSDVKESTGRVEWNG
jgi:hypothetical protein